MLLNKTTIWSSILLLLIVAGGCKKSYEPPPHNLFENEQLIEQTAKDLLGENISFTTSGYFETDSVKSIVAGKEISEKKINGGLNSILSVGLMESLKLSMKQVC